MANSKPNTKPLNLYIHIPWCIKKCPYCDFNSHQIKANLNKNPDKKLDKNLEQDYINHLIFDLKQSLKLINYQDSYLDTIFIGGGTPSLFSAKSIYNLLTKINNIIPINNTTEVTLEANPSTFEYNKFHDYKLAGINRLSIGVQSFDNQLLKNLGRIHDSSEALNAITIAKELDFNLNIDLMHTLPNQDTNLALKDLTTAINFEPNHLSWYQLTIEPNTQFAKKTPILPNDEISDDIYLNGLELLEHNNYRRYEISAYTKSINNQSHKSRHNLNYWRYGDYIGIGAGAHSKYTTRDNSNNIIKITRNWKQKSPVRYSDNAIDKISGSTDIINNQDLVLEYMMNKLRILEPLTEIEFTNHTNLTFNAINTILNTAETNNWLKWLTKTNNQFQVTELGYKFLNDFILLFA